MKKIYPLLLFIAFTSSMVFSQNVGIGTNSPNYKLDVKGDVNVATGNGYRVNGSAGAGQYLRGDGTRFTPNNIQPADVPQGSGYYIWNGTTLQTGDFRLSGNGSVGSLSIGSATPNNSAILDITSGNKGVSFPNVDLQSAADATTIALPKKGLVVYNTGATLSPGGLYINTGLPASPNWQKLNDAGGSIASISVISPLTSTGGGNPTLGLGVVPVSLGGTGLTAVGAGQLLIGTSSNAFLNTTLTSGTGININSTSGSITVTNTAPDQTVVLNGGSSISVSGTYPNFTIANTAPSSGGTVTSISAGSGITLSPNPITTTGTITNAGVTSLTGTPNRVTVSAATGAVTVTAPQDIHAGASPVFAGLNLSGLTASTAVYTDGSKNLTSTQPNNGSIGYWTRDNTNSYLYQTTLTDKVGLGTATPYGKLNVAGSGTVLSGNGLLLGTIGASIATSVAVGAETGRFEIAFAGWRDSEPNQIGAKIAGIRRNNYQPNNALIQSTDLAFFTGTGTTGGSGTSLLDITSEKMRIDFNGNVAIGNTNPLSGGSGTTTLQLGRDNVSPTTAADGQLVLSKTNGSTSYRSFKMGLNSSYHFSLGDFGGNGSNTYTEHLTVRYDNGNVGIGNSPSQKLDVQGNIALQGKLALQGNDTWLRLNQTAAFTSGTYTPGLLRADGGLASGGVAPGAGNIQATGWLGVNSLGNAYGGVNGVNSPYYHTSINDSWLSYPGNNYNYLRGLTYAFNNTWYDESDGNYYVDPNATTRLNALTSYSASPTITFEDNDNVDYYIHVNSDRFYLLYGDGGWNGDRALTVLQGNKVGFGTASPSFPVEISGGIATGNNSYGYLNGSGNTGSASGNIAYSLAASNRIRCPEFNAISDIRIKHVKGISDPISDLETLLKIQVTDYTHIDTVASGSAVKKGFIAQQVEKVYPQAVITSTGWLPDIYCLSTGTRFCAEDSSLEVLLNKPHNLKPGDKVKFIRLNKETEATVNRVFSDCSFAVTNWEGRSDSLFVFGKFVDDFKAVDYDRIHTLNVSVTQGLIKKIEEQQARIEELEKQNSSLQLDNTEIIKSMKAQLDLINERLNIKSER
ncbi:MAG TPA: tail fiber domain-containing protein [Chitinophagales bacterium]|nr:tail fiber domain-containing protein [Chitinophagales bacterium]